ncbi:hypothetical protein E4U50_000813, partial [Claviceps purpurea]
ARKRGLSHLALGFGDLELKLRVEASFTREKVEQWYLSSGKASVPPYEDELPPATIKGLHTTTMKSEFTLSTSRQCTYSDPWQEDRAG